MSSVLRAAFGVLCFSLFIAHAEALDLTDVRTQQTARPGETIRVTWTTNSTTRITSTNVLWGTTPGHHPNATPIQKGAAGNDAWYQQIVMPATPGDFYFVVQARSSGHQRQTSVEQHVAVAWPKPPGSTTLTTQPNAAIPDADLNGIDVPLDVAKSGAIDSIEVRVNIAHTYRGDLSLDLVSPSGTTIRLKSENGNDNVANVFGTYGVDLSPVQPLDPLIGTEVNGTWKLHVVDHYQGDTGTVNELSLIVVLRASAPSPSPSPSTSPSPSPNPSPSTSPSPTPAPSPSGPIELALPNITPKSPDEISIDSTTTPGKKTLKLGNTVRNLGKGPFELRGEVDPNTGDTKAYQRIYRIVRDATGKFDHFEFVRENLVGHFTFVGHGGHDHFHFDKFAVYSLLDGTTLQPVPNVPVGDKVSFCIMDFGQIDLTMEGAPQTGVYSCDQFKQGISVGWSDTYGAGLDGQELDITNAPDGVYYLVTQSTTALEESNDPDKTDNAAATKIQIHGNDVTVLEQIDGYELARRMGHPVTPPSPGPSPSPSPTPSPSPSAWPSIGVPSVPAALSGIDQRTPNDTVIISSVDTPVAPNGFVTQRVFPGFDLRSATYVTHAGDHTNRLFVCERQGLIWALDPVADPTTDTPPRKVFLDLTSVVRWNAGGNEEGLLSVAFHPQFDMNGYAYVAYTIGSNYSPATSDVVRTRISRFTAKGAMPGTSMRYDELDPSSEVVLLEIEKKWFNHNGGHLVFGPDGMLYITVGDGGSGGDPDGNGQNLGTLKAKILRIDVDHGSPYAIPADNPFVNTAGAKGEIWAYGLRNPWRIAFDRHNGTLYCGDVGQDAWEEVDVITRGGNYGWSIYEGNHPYNSGSAPNAIGPIVEYDHASLGGGCVIGGYVYRGPRLGNLQGMYIYGDYVNHKVWALRWDGTSVTSHLVLIDNLSFDLSSFGEDEAGEVYLVQYDEAGRGGLYRLAPAGAAPPSSFPQTLSGTGIFSDIVNQKMRPEFIPYAPNEPFWSDFAIKDRYFTTPHTQPVVRTAGMGWTLPDESIAVKHFYLERKRGDPTTKMIVETRLLVKNSGQWHGYSFEWNSAGTDANLLQTYKHKQFTVNVNGVDRFHDYYFPDRAECFRCHTDAAGRTLGLETSQLNGDFDYSRVGGRVANQLNTIDHLAMFTQPLAPDTPATLPKMPSHKDTTATLEQRARAWLHVNCSMCHRPRGGAPVQIDLRYDTPLAQTGIVDAAPQAGDLGLTGAKIVKSRDPDNSVLWRRMSTRGATQMPPLATQYTDDEAVQLLRDWINSLP